MKAFVFVLEDEPTELDLLKRYLEAFLDPSDRILTANNGEDAIRTIQQSNPKPGVFILDLNMPGKVKGKDVLRWINEQPELQPCAKIIFSSSTNPKDRQDCFEIGCDEYCTKPKTLAETKTRIKGLLKKYRDRHPKKTDSNRYSDLDSRIDDLFS